MLTLATCNLNQWALDFEGNRDRIVESIVIAKERGAAFRTGPELEVCGYGCLDHFLEADTFLHSWQVLCDILRDPRCSEIVADVGMPVLHRGIRYNCRVLLYNGRILFVRPKIWLANDGNYREMRHFVPWKAGRLGELELPAAVRDATGQTSVPFGDAVMSAGGVRFGFETCEELFTPQSPHIQQALCGVDIFTNSSGSHHELRKLDTRLSLITEATRKCGGVYLYANQQGCDGDRLYYDGSAMIVVNGRVVAQGSQFSLTDVEVVTAHVDLEEVHSYRSAVSFGMQSRELAEYPEVRVADVELRSDKEDQIATAPIKPHIYAPQQEIALGPACWLWDYLRRSRAAGYFVPLSGGIDSCATAVIVYSMCTLVHEQCIAGNEQVLADARRIANREGSDWVPKSPQEFCNAVFSSCYMGTENSSADTRARAKELAAQIGANHYDVNIDSIVASFVALITTIFGKRPQFKVYGGSVRENLALQNIQARLRMVLAYTMALLIPWVRSMPGGLLVLGSANVDESLRGYFTKYDNSAADINPIGSISKLDLTEFVSWGAEHFKLPILTQFVNATPTAELEPITESYTQSDEADMGLTYYELGVFGKLRKVGKMGPYSMFMKLRHEWSDTMPMSEIATKVKRFFYYYAINRHKMTVLTPAYHAEAYSPDDNRFDMRPFLIKPFPWAFALIDKYVEAHETKVEKE